MKKLYMILCICLQAGLFTACHLSEKSQHAKPEKLTRLVGTQPGELQKRIDRMLLEADSVTDLEFIFLESSYEYYNDDYYEAQVRWQSVDPKDTLKKKHLYCSWTDSPKARDQHQHFSVYLTQGDDEAVYPYDSIRARLFSYDLAKEYIDRLPHYASEAVKASGWGDQGYVNRFAIEINKEPASSEPDVQIRIGRKDDREKKLAYRVAPDKKRLIPVAADK